MSFSTNLDTQNKLLKDSVSSISPNENLIKSDERSETSDDLPLRQGLEYFFPVGTPEDRLFKCLYDLGVVDNEGGPNRNYPFPPIPNLSSKEGDLDRLVQVLTEKIRIFDGKTVHESSKELWELLDVLKEFKGMKGNKIIEGVHLVGGKARQSFSVSWHQKAAKSLQILKTDEIKDIAVSLRSLLHHPRDSDIRFYASNSSSYDLRNFMHAQTCFLAQALSEVKKVNLDFSYVKSCCLEKFYACEKEGNYYSIVAFGDRERKNWEILLINRLLKNNLWKDRAREIPSLIDVVEWIKEQKIKKTRREIEIEPCCFKMGQDGSLEPSPIYEQWDAIFSQWFKILRTKKIGRIKGGWSSSIVQELKGDTCRTSDLADRLYENMMNMIVSEEKSVSEIVNLLKRAVKDHLGNEAIFFTAAAWAACLRLKGKLEEVKLREVFKGMISSGIEFQKNKEKKLFHPFYSMLEQIIADNSIPLQLVEDVIQLCGILNLASYERDGRGGISFFFKKHLGKPMLQGRIQLNKEKICCFNVEFDPISCFKNLVRSFHLLNPLIMKFIRLMYQTGLKINFEQESPLERDCRPLSLHFDYWAECGMEWIQKQGSNPYLKEIGLDLYLISFLQNPLQEQAKLLLKIVLDFFSKKEKPMKQIQSILNIMTIAMSRHSSCEKHFAAVVDSLQQFVNEMKECTNPGGKSKIRISGYCGDWLLRLGRSEDFHLRELGVQLCLELLESDTNYLFTGYQLAESFVQNGYCDQALHLIRTLQFKKERDLSSELNILIALIKFLDERNSIFIQSLQTLMLNALEKSTFPLSEEGVVAIVYLVEAGWKEEVSSELSLKIFRKLLKKEWSSEPSLLPSFWLEGCFKALNCSQGGLSFAFEVWSCAPLEWKVKTRGFRSAELCLDLLEQLQKCGIDIKSPQNLPLCEEVSIVMRSLPKNEYEHFHIMSSRVEALSIPREFMGFVQKGSELNEKKRHLGGEFLFRLQLSELTHFLQQKEWDSALNLIQMMFGDELKEIHALSIDLFFELLKKSFDQIPLTPLRISSLIKILSHKKFKNTFLKYSAEYTKMLAFLLEALEASHPSYSEKIARLFFNQANTWEEFSLCQNAILSMCRRGETDCLTINGREGTALRLFSSLAHSKRYLEVVSLIILLNEQGILSKYPTDALRYVWEVLESFSPLANHEAELYFQAFQLLVKLKAFQSDDKVIVRVIKNLIDSSHYFSFGNSFKILIRTLPTFLNHSETIIQALFRKEDVENLFCLLQALTPDHLDVNRLEFYWGNLFILSKSLKKKNPLIKLYALRYQTTPVSPEKIELFLNQFLDETKKQFIEQVFECAYCKKVTSVAIWKKILQIYTEEPALKKQLFRVCNLLLEVLIQIKSTDHLGEIFSLLLEASLKLTLHQWLSLVKKLPSFEAQEMTSRTSLYSQVLTKGLQGVSDQASDKDLLFELFSLRKKIRSLASSSLEMIDVKYFKMMINQGHEDLLEKGIEEIEGLLESFHGSDKMRHQLVLLLSQICLKISENRSEKPGSVRLKIEEKLIEIFKKLSNMEIYTDHQLSTFFHSLLISLTPNNNVALVMYAREYILKNKEGLSFEWVIEKRNVMVEEMVKLKSQSGYITAFYLYFLFKKNISLSVDKILIETLDDAARGSNDEYKEKAINCFITLYEDIISDKKISERLLKSMSSCLVSLLGQPQSWELFNQLLDMLLSFIHPLVWTREWRRMTQDPTSGMGLNVYYGSFNNVEYFPPCLDYENLSENELFPVDWASVRRGSLILEDFKNHEATFFNNFICPHVFEVVQIFDFLSNLMEQPLVSQDGTGKPAILNKKDSLTIEEKRKKIPTLFSEQNKIFYQTLLKIVDAMITRLSSKEDLSIHPNLVSAMVEFCCIELAELIFNSDWQNNQKNDPFGELRILLDRFIFEISFKDKQQYDRHVFFIKLLTGITRPVTNIYDNSGLFRRWMFVAHEVNYETIKNIWRQSDKDGVLSAFKDLVKDLISCDNPIAFVKLLEILEYGYWEIFKDKPKDIVNLFEKIFKEAVKMGNPIVYNKSMVESIRIIIMYFINSINPKHQLMPPNIMRSHTAFTLTLFVQFFKFVQSFYKPRTNCENLFPIQIEKNKEIQNLQEYLKLCLKDALAAGVFKDSPEKYKELLTTVLNL